MVEVSRHYGLPVATCEPADPQSEVARVDREDRESGSGADRPQLREEYADWQALEQACQEFMADVNTRAHRSTRQPPVILLSDEHEDLHRLPRMQHTLCFGQTRKVDRQGSVSVGDAIYSVPHGLIGERVWVRADGEQLVVVHVDEAQGPREVARHELTTPGRPSIKHEHYPPGRRAVGAQPRARSAEEREFLEIGEGAERWLKRAAAEGTSRIRRRMAEAVDPAKLLGTRPVDWALERCASYGRSADCDLASILADQHTGTVIRSPREPRRRARCRPRPAAGRDSANDRLLHRHPRAARPEQSDPLRGGGRLKHVSVILTDRHDRQARPVGIALLACQARELPFELLELAEHAEVLSVLLAEEAARRDRATINLRRRASGLPAGKTVDA
jgi:hypothetical protein